MAPSRRRFLAAAASLPFLPRLLAADKPAEANPVPAANNAFGCDLFAQLRTRNGNVFFSPFSIETALAMTAAGAKGNTLKEMQSALHLPAESEKAHAGFKALLADLNGEGKKDRGYALNVANALWGAKGYPWKKEYLATASSTFGGGLTPVDFADEPAARKLINGWVEDRTAKKIKDLIPSGVLKADTRMVLTNAVYFKGTWRVEFDKKDTKDGPFTGADGKKTDVPLMHMKANLQHAATDDVQAVELEYRGGETSMTVLLPKKADGLAAVEKALTADLLATVRKGMRKTEVTLTLPRFKMETDYSLVPQLQALGIKAAFGNADFSGMADGEKLFVSDVLHKAFVEVNEEGTEAAASTAVVVAKHGGGPPPPVTFTADRPFLFVIRHTPTGTVLFVGRCEKP